MNADIVNIADFRASSPSSHPPLASDIHPSDEQLKAEIGELHAVAPEAGAKFAAAEGTIILPVEAGSSLADDCATVVAVAEREVAEFRAMYDAERSGAGSPTVQQRHRETPRKSLGLVAKRASPTVQQRHRETARKTTGRMAKRA